MTVEIRVPTLGESVTEATVAKWLKQPGERVERDEPVVELETDKVTLEVPAPQAGVVGAIHVAEGDNVPVGAVLGTIADGAAGAAPHPSAASAAGPPSPALRERENVSAGTETLSRIAGEGGDGRGPAPGEGRRVLDRAGPAVRKLVAESGVEAATLTPTGPGGRLTKADVIAARQTPAPRAEVEAPPISARERPPVGPPPAERETRVRMTRLRRRIAERLKEAQHNAAMLTTFNEIDMSATMALRERWRDVFEKKHGIRLGFMSIFVKAAIVALKEFPAVNAEIDGDDIVYKNHYDIGVAVGIEQGLVVPVVRDADTKSFAEIEKEIAALGRKARDGRLTIEDLSGGTFTISNGGVYGSLLSTPILNPPQSAILGMHKIERRPIAVGDKIEIRPMMYVALTYDHRIIDGREAVTFLVRIKECVEDPSRLLFDI
ncbi:MAG: 2-oxoglutarate dehydrogenase complex dihydrolipoyllysine-residue succinyltransferase [Alphaproteobacteria bacterium]